MTWIYLSPHFDDVALSCGGLLWEQAQAGEPAQVWTVCAAGPAPGPLSAFAEGLHRRWQTGPEAVEQRRLEDAAANQHLRAGSRTFDLADCIYRRGPAVEPLYASEEAIFGPVHPQDQLAVDRLTVFLERELQAQDVLVCPLGLGSHVDHQLVRTAAERLGRPLWYYPDYPYAVRYPGRRTTEQQSGWQGSVFPVGTDGLDAWQQAVAAHRSQLSTFWPSLEAMRHAIREYWQVHRGIWLWRKNN